MVYSTLLFFQGCEAPLGRGGSGSNFQLNNADELFTTDTKKVERWRWITCSPYTEPCRNTSKLKSSTACPSKRSAYIP